MDDDPRLVSLVLVLIGGVAGAQDPILVLEGTSAEPLDHAVAGTGDVDGDGVPDLLVGYPNAHPPGAGSGLARLYSGAWLGSGTGPAVLFEWTTPTQIA